MLDGLEALGLVATAVDVGAAVKELFPQGTAGIDGGEVIRDGQRGRFIGRAALKNPAAETRSPSGVRLTGEVKKLIRLSNAEGRAVAVAWLVGLARPALQNFTGRNST